MSSFSDNKIKTPGFSAGPNRYYASRAQLSYHPASKRFAGSGQVTVQEAPPPPPPQQTAQVESSGGKKSRAQELADYEADYMKRMAEDAQASAQADEEAAEKKASKGSLPKGF
ncbi:MAG: hypothetical protein NPMRIOTA_250003 [Nitrosopumilales archaeon]|nr:MAG: hypothetical protein NPMRIOTA_250003 [Nitrosopumilales archaeon]